MKTLYENTTQLLVCVCLLYSFDGFLMQRKKERKNMREDNILRHHPAFAILQRDHRIFLSQRSTSITHTHTHTQAERFFPKGKGWRKRKILNALSLSLTHTQTHYLSLSLSHTHTHTQTPQSLVEWINLYIVNIFYSYRLCI